VSDVLIDRLRQDIEAGSVLVLAGTGVSVAASGRATTANWLGLLRSGATYAEQVKSLPPGWRASVDADLALAETGYLAATLDVANKVEAALGGAASGDFREWLRRDLGGLTVADRTLIDALLALNAPIATTNYDNLIEDCSSRSHVVWSDPSAVQLAARGETQDVIHLHGHWRDPKSVILGSYSYGRLAENGPAQALEHALVAIKSLLFVGCGAGLEDPNFEALRQWLRANFADSECRHYRLCTDAELPALRQEHEDERITPVVYGRLHADLPAFLGSLGRVDRRSAVAVMAAAPQRAFDAICERVRTEAVLAEHVPDVEDRSLDALLVPPVLLPMTQQQFRSAQGLDRDLRPSRCSPSEDVRAGQPLLVVAEENAGLTSALEWVVAEAHRQDRDLVPVLVDFRSLGQGHEPLKRQVQKELSQAGALSSPRDALPDCALALDNVLSRPEKVFNRVIEELTSGPYRFVVIGCRRGTEADVTEKLAAAGIQTSLRYIGRMARRDVTALASLVAPARASELASRALEIAQREHLARTPMTLGLLISVLLHGESLLGTASETALLDAYVSLLLGRGDPHDDARFALDSMERAEILGVLAQHFVEANAGSLPEDDVIGSFRRYFDSVGWEEDAIELYRNLKARHILAAGNGQVRFSQSSFLHLFAAKRAIRSGAFRSVLFDRPVHYAAIIRHYAALTRDDIQALHTVERLLGSAADDPTVSGRSFDIEERSSPVTIERLLAKLEISEQSAPIGPERPRQNDPDSYEDWLDRLDRDDIAPFPAEDLENLPPATQIINVLVLVSNVLRDSELVQDLGLKERVLRQTLVVWAKLVDALDADPDYQEFLDSLAEELAVSLNVPAGKQDHFKLNFMESGAVLTALGGMSATLASRKLTRQLDRSMGDDHFVRNVGPALMGALLGFDLQAPGWSRYFLDIHRRHGRVKAVSLVLHGLARSAYASETLRPDDTEALETFLVEQLESRSTAPGNELQAKQNRARLAQALRRQRMTALARARGGKALRGDGPNEVIEGELSGPDTR
jgi:hypothetical protein